MLFTQVGAKLGSGCSDLPKLLLVHLHQLLLCLAQLPALLFKDFCMQGQRGKKKRRNMTEDEKIHILHKVPFLMVHAVEPPLPPSSAMLTAMLFRGFYLCTKEPGAVCSPSLGRVGSQASRDGKELGTEVLMGGFMGLHEGSAHKRS